jgi:hypothetical protein
MKRNQTPFLFGALATLLVVWAAPRLTAIEIVNNQFVMDENQFNQWLYRGTRSGIDEESEVKLMIESVDRSCHLNDSQKEKLRLAAQGDYARFKDEIDELRNQYVGKSFDQNEIGRIYEKIQPYTTRYQAGLLGESSLFSKVFHRMLTPEQREEYESALAERNKARHAAKVRLFVAIFDQSCPMKAAQREAMVDLLLKETRPPLRISEYDWYVVVIQVAKIPEEKVKAILDEAQMRCFKKVTQQVGGMEMHLKQIGVLPK